MKTPIRLYLLTALVLSGASCRPRDEASAKSADGPAKIDDSNKAVYFAVITAATPRTASPYCKGPFCGLDSIQLETVEPKSAPSFKVDTNTLIDEEHSDAVDAAFIATAIEKKTVFAFKTAAYNGPNSPSHVIDINTNILMGPVSHLVANPAATDCTPTLPFCKFSEIQITAIGQATPVAVDFNTASDASLLQGTFSAQEAYTSKRPLYFAISRKEKGTTSNPLVLVVGLTAAIKP